MVYLEDNKNNLHENYGENSKWREVIQYIARLDQTWVTLK